MYSEKKRTFRGVLIACRRSLDHSNFVPQPNLLPSIWIQRLKSAYFCIFLRYSELKSYVLNEFYYVYFGEQQNRINRTALNRVLLYVLPCFRPEMQKGVSKYMFWVFGRKRAFAVLHNEKATSGIIPIVFPMEMCLQLSNVSTRRTYY